MDGRRKRLRFVSFRLRPWSPLILGTIVGGVVGALVSPLIANGHVEAAWNTFGYPLVGAIGGAFFGFFIEAWLSRKDDENNVDSK
ncbi:MAG: hypothetical protein RIC55_25540 [Pirellulaceae bacterium]